MQEYAANFMDERDLASHEFRKQNTGGKSLSDFISQEERGSAEPFEFEKEAFIQRKID